jgi:hypothetical protein
MEPKKLKLDALKVASYITDTGLAKWGKKDPTGAYPCGSTVCSQA